MLSPVGATSICIHLLPLVALVLAILLITIVLPTGCISIEDH